MTTNRDVLRRLGTLLKEASYTKKVLETLGKAATDTLVNKLMSDENFDLRGFFETHKKIYESERLERKIHQLCEKKIGGKFKGETVDAFSAFMVSNKVEINSKSFKMLSRHAETRRFVQVNTTTQRSVPQNKQHDKSISARTPHQWRIIFKGRLG